MSIRRILRTGGIILAARGPHGRANWTVTAAQARAAAARQATVVAAMERLSRELHFASDGAGTPRDLSGETPELAPGGFHFGGRYEAESVERRAAFLIRAIEAERRAPERPA